MSFQARFKCVSVKRLEGECEQWEFAAVNAADGKGNESWSKWTPSGTLTMTVTNPALLGTIVPGRFYALMAEDVG